MDHMIVVRNAPPSRREEVALVCLQALLSDPTGPEYHTTSKSQETVRQAFELADAFLAHRDTTPQNEKRE